MTAPNPVPDRAAAELAEDHFRRQVMAGLSPTLSALHGAALLAELDRQRALIAGVLAESRRREELWPISARFTCSEIRALLGGKGR